MNEMTGGDRARCGRIGVVALLGLGFLSSLMMGTSARAFEAAAPDGAHHAAEGHAGEAEAGHEKMEGPITAYKRDVDLAIWSLITFVVFVYVLRKLAWGPLIEGLDKRESRVLQSIADAESARINAEKMLAAHTEKLDKVQDEIRELLAEARRDAEHAKTDIMATAQKEAEATKQRAVQEIERARDQALDELFAHMGQAVRQATEQVVGRSLTGADHERLITEALNSVTPSKN